MMKKMILLLSLFIFFSFANSVIGDNSDNYRYEIRENGAVITSYSGSESELTIPLLLGDSSVVGIADRAFENNDMLLSITMPSTIEFIGERAFAGCSNLASVAVSSGLKHIGAEAFGNCRSLTYFILPSLLETIGQKAFAGCENIIYIQDLTGDSLNEIGSGAFDDTPWFINNNDETITINHGCFLLKYKGNAERYTLPWDIFYIAEDAFADNDEVSSLTLPNNIKKLQRGSISHMDNLKRIYCNTTIETVDEGAFNDLPALEMISIRNENWDTSNFIDCPKSPFGSEMSGPFDPALPDESDELFISDYDESMEGVVILHCRADAEIPDGVLRIPDYIKGKRVIAIGVGACQDRTDIKSVIFPKYLKEIRSWAFAYDINLSEAEFPETLETIEADAFNHCGLDPDRYDLSNTIVDDRAFYLSNN